MNTTTPAAFEAPNEVQQQTGNELISETEDAFIQDPEAWPTLDPTAIYGGFIRRFIDAACENSEADPVAVLLTFLTRFSVEVGTTPFMWISDGKQHVNLLTAIVGVTGNGRKGTSAKPVDRLFRFHDPNYSSAVAAPGPLSSGEGVIYAVRDEIMAFKKGCWEVIDPGIQDKRLYIQSEELASALKSMKRDGNTLSTVIRQIYDSGTLSPLTKTKKITATGAHIGVVGHITMLELELLLGQIEFRNGFANRFLWVCSRRHKEIPFPKPISDNDLSKFQAELLEILNCSREITEIRYSDEAKEIWMNVYLKLSKGNGGIIGDLLGRATNHIIRLSMLHALMDFKTTIEAHHIETALAIWDYCEQSARYIFESQAAVDPVQKKVVEALQAGPKTATEINKYFNHHAKAEKIQMAIKELAERKKILLAQGKGAGRPATIYSLQKAAA